MTSELDKFIATIARLRAPNGCPWDREQTHRTLARYLLEETYEVLEAMHADSPQKLQEELGDLLLQIVLNAQVAQDAGQFSIQDVARSINEKMINRHPHVFADAQAKHPQDVVKQWEELKNIERRSTHSSALDGISATFPALLRALKVSEKAVAQGFEWRSEEEVWQKLSSELDELKAAIAHPDRNDPDKKTAARRELELELGDVLFTLVNIGRWHSINAEEALILAIEKFEKRFREMETRSDRPLKQLSFDELDGLWKTVKQS